ncbi:hypothetical protein BvCms12BK_02593 [Escherichia coli]|nr:hypothetical protein BvCms12BK_02593 [Escherichia coli]
MFNVITHPTALDELLEFCLSRSSMRRSFDSSNADAAFSGSTDIAMFLLVPILSARKSASPRSS